MSRMASRWASILVWVASGLSLAAVTHGASAPPIVGAATRHGKSARLSDYRVQGPTRPSMTRQIPNKGTPKKGDGLSRPVSDPVVQRAASLARYA